MTEQEENEEQFSQSSNGNHTCRHCGYYPSEHKVIEGMIQCPKGN